MSAKEKGRRRERQAREIYEAAGYAVQPFYGRRYGETDGFGLFDFVAIGPRGTEFVQVKSNRAEGIEQWCEDTLFVQTVKGVCPIMLVCHDREGWRYIIPMDRDAWTCAVDERDMDCAMGEGVTAWLAEGPVEA